MNPTLLVLAAGMGSRYGGLKQIDAMGPHGETVLDYSVFDAIRAGFDKVVFVIREDFAGAFQTGIGARFEGRIDVSYAFQQLDDLPDGFRVPEGRTKPWGTAHAVRAARHSVHGRFAVINADDFYGRDAYRRVTSFFATLPAEDDHAMAMVGYPLENTLSEHGRVNRGICRLDPQGCLATVEEHIEIEQESDGRVLGTGLDGRRHVIAPDSPASMNFWAFGPAFFQQLEAAFTCFLGKAADPLKSECYIPSVVDQLVRDGHARCQVLPTTSQWFGVTYPADKPRVVESINKLVALGEYPARIG